MNDIELMKAAAKAAGYDMADTCDGYPLFVNGVGLWNPLTDDGDALRLAVKLRIEYTFSPLATWVQTETVPLHVEMLHEPHGDDPSAATRRAIVRAAAAMAT